MGFERHVPQHSVDWTRKLSRTSLVSLRNFTSFFFVHCCAAVIGTVAMTPYGGFERAWGRLAWSGR